MLNIKCVYLTYFYTLIKQKRNGMLMTSHNSQVFTEKTNNQIPRVVSGKIWCSLVAQQGRNEMHWGKLTSSRSHSMKPTSLRIWNSLFSQSTTSQHCQYCTVWNHFHYLWYLQKQISNICFWTLSMRFKELVISC